MIVLKQCTNVEICTLNEKGKLSFPVSVFRRKKENITAYFYGYLSEIQKATKLICGYGIARSTIEFFLGSISGAECRIHVYLNPDIAKQILGHEAGFFDISSQIIHAYPWLSIGHEICHFLSFKILGGRSSILLEEGLSSFFSHPFISVHPAVKYVLIKGLGGAFISDVIQRQDTGSRIKRMICGSFVGYLLDTYGIQIIKEHWLNPSPNQSCIRELFHKSYSEIISDWFDFLHLNKIFTCPYAIVYNEAHLSRCRQCVESVICDHRRHTDAFT